MTRTASTSPSREPLAAKWFGASVSGSSRSRASRLIAAEANPGGQLRPVPTAVPPSGSSPTADMAERIASAAPSTWAA